MNAPRPSPSPLLNTSIDYEIIDVSGLASYGDFNLVFVTKLFTQVAYVGNAEVPKVICKHKLI